MPSRRCRAALGVLSLGLLLSAARVARSLEAVPDAVDVRRMRIEDTRVVAPAPRGGVAELTLDPELTAAATRLLELARPVEGALVALDPRTGQVLAWSETRSAGAAGGSVITTARAPAASVFKLITTAALFELGGVHPKERVCISGGMRSIERKHLERPRAAEASCAAFSEALGHSRNAAFAQLATRRLMRSDLIDVAQRFGFNTSVPFDWPVPVGQLSVPYNDLAFARTAAGFQGSTLSPLGGAYLASIIASGGLGRPLHILRPPTSSPSQPPPEPPVRVISPSTAQRMARMMEVTVHSGTCRAIFTDEAGRSLLPGVRVAGKTGTLKPETRTPTSSWFIGFAPSRDPRVVVSVLLQNGAVWHQRAAEVARDFLRAYFSREGLPGIQDPLAGHPRRPG